MPKKSAPTDGLKTSLYTVQNYLQLCMYSTLYNYVHFIYICYVSLCCVGLKQKLEKSYIHML